MRQSMCCLAMIVLAAGCAKNIESPVNPVTFSSLREALLEVCAAPGSHDEIGAAVRGLGWTSLTGNQVPKQVTGNGMVTWTTVAERPDRAMLVAAGRLNRTSFCRVYSRQAPTASIQAELENAVVLGEPLGHPDFKKQIGDQDIVGWHLGADDNWRALHLSSATKASEAPEMPTMVEMTRPAI